MSQLNFDAVIFDLDGVITQTALVHSAAWKKMFDEYLATRAGKTGEEFLAFSHEKDYLPYVDGKPRYKGVESFLQSRGIELPFGDPADDPGKETVCGLGNRKNQAFNEVLDRDGVKVYPSTVELIHELKRKGCRVGVASSSKNCQAVLEKAGLIDLIETRVDGVVSAELGLNGKPEPDIFTTAADNLGVACDRSVVVEDAVSGVQAGRKGNFGLVLGIARENNRHELKLNGADLVVEDIGEIGLQGIVDWFDKGLEADCWSITYDDFVPEKEKTRETLLTVGNGYFGTRGAPEEIAAGEHSYPGTYIAGLYNRLTSRVGDRDIENEDFVNCTHWLPVEILIDGMPVEINPETIRSISRKLDLKSGLLTRIMQVCLPDGKELYIRSERFASMDDPHLAGSRYEVKAVNFSGTLEIKTGIDGRIINDGVARYRELNQQHLAPVSGEAEDDTLLVTVKTVQSGITVATASHIDFRATSGAETGLVRMGSEAGKASASCSFRIEAGGMVEFEKLVSIYTSQPWDAEDPAASASNALEHLPGYDKLLENSQQAWAKIWKETDVKIEGDRLAQKLLRLHLYHLLVSFSPHNGYMDASITARGLHGEAYRGHIFWDELFILPLYNLHFPLVTRAALLYRFRRLAAARQYAAEHGFRGAMFPWQSGSDGREETQVVHLNPLTGKWGADFSSFQRHVSLAIAYNVWQYFHATADAAFMEEAGAEMFLEICRFWASKAQWNEGEQRYSIKNVMGPDEFHEKYPGSTAGGLKDNAYTNIMVAWMFGKAFELNEQLGKEKLDPVLRKLGVQRPEFEHWQEIASKLHIVISGDIIAQYDGYFDLKELDWDAYREKYGNIYRMDRLLKAEGKSADDYKVAKQADTLQTFYNLDEETVTGILEQLGYQLSGDYLEKNLAYYLARTSHGSTLSRVVHAQLANMIDDRDLSWKLYQDALTSDFADIQGGTTGEGIHAGVMAGTVLIALQSFAGVDLRGDQVKVNPAMPAHWRKISFGFSFKNNRYELAIGQGEVEITVHSDQSKTVKVDVSGKLLTLKEGEKQLVKLS